MPAINILAIPIEDLDLYQGLYHRLKALDVNVVADFKKLSPDFMEQYGLLLIEGIERVKRQAAELEHKF